MKNKIKQRNLTTKPLNTSLNIRRKVCQKLGSKSHKIFLAFSSVFVALLAGLIVAHMSYKAEASPYEFTMNGNIVRMKMSSDIAIGEIRKAKKNHDYIVGPAHRAEANISAACTLSSEQEENQQYGLLNFTKGKIKINSIFENADAGFSQPNKKIAPKDNKLFPPELTFAENIGRGLSFLQLSQCSLAQVFMSENLLNLTQKFNIFAKTSSLPNKAGKYNKTVDVYAKKYKLSPSMVMAIMRTESNFNPYAISSMQAVGLMQVVPSTAGEEVYSYLYGFSGTPSAEELMHPEKNIYYGTTYLHLLASRYFNKVINKTSRELCVIAAYNGGPGATLRVFNLNPNAAIEKINSLSSDEVYEKLTSKMPSQESRKYVDKVLGHARNFSYLN